MTQFFGPHFRLIYCQNLYTTHILARRSLINTQLQPNPCSWGLCFHAEAAEAKRLGCSFSTAMQLRKGQVSFSKRRAHQRRCGPSRTANRIVVYPPLRLTTPPVVKTRNRSVAAV